MIGEPFDPKGELIDYEHCRPHWAQAGAVVFITFRTHDSIPRHVLDLWDRQKHDWLIERGKHTGAHWADVIATLSEMEQAEFRKKFDRTREMYLDTCHGRCLIKRPELAQIVADSLLHFNGERYRMGDFVVMPNHVHLLAAFPSAEIMKSQCDSWLHSTAMRINRVLGEKGKF